MTVIFFTFLGTVPVPVQLGKIASFPPQIEKISVVFQQNWETQCVTHILNINTLNNLFFLDFQCQNTKP